MSKKRLPTERDAMDEKGEKKHEGDSSIVDAKQLRAFVAAETEKNVLPSLCEYITVPNLSPDFDPEIHTNGHQEKALHLIVNWLQVQKMKGMNIQVCYSPLYAHAIL